MRPLSAIARHPHALVLLGLACAAISHSGCRPEVLENTLAVSAPLVVGSRLAYLDTTRERVTVVRPFRREVQHFAAGQRPHQMVASPDQRQLLVLSRGWDGMSRTTERRTPALQVIDLEQGTQQSYALSAPYDLVAISDDGLRAVATFSDSASPDQGEVFRNPNAVAIIDLERRVVQTKTVRSFGAVPSAVAFSPADMAPLRVDGSPGSGRVLAAVLARGTLTLVDIAHPERSEVTIRLALPGSEISIVPRDLVFATGAGAIYVLADGSDDIFVISLTERQPRSAQENDFAASISSLAAGTGPGDLALFSDGGRAKVLVANRSSADLTVIDAATAQFVSIPVGEPVDRILLYPPEAPRLALLSCLARQRSALFVLDLEDVENRTGRNLTRLDSDAPVQALQWIPGRARALVLHGGNRTVLSVLDVDDRSLFPLTGQGPLDSFALAASGDLLAGAIAGQEQIGLVDLDSLGTRTWRLDQEPAQVLTLHPGAPELQTDEARGVVVNHDSPLGRVTVITDPAAPATDGSFVFQGFLQAGVLDDRYPDEVQP